MVPPTLECESDTRNYRPGSTGRKMTSELLAYIAAMDCPVCGKQAHIAGGRELIIKSIEIETENENESQR